MYKYKVVREDEVSFEQVRKFFYTDICTLLLMYRKAEPWGDLPETVGEFGTEEEARKCFEAEKAKCKMSVSECEEEFNKRRYINIRTDYVGLIREKLPDDEGLYPYEYTLTLDEYFEPYIPVIEPNCRIFFVESYNADGEFLGRYDPSFDLDTVRRYAEYRTEKWNEVCAVVGYDVCDYGYNKPLHILEANDDVGTFKKIEPAYREEPTGQTKKPNN